LRRPVPTQEVTNVIGSTLFYRCQYVPLLLDYKSYFFIFQTIGLNDLVHPSRALHFKTFNLFMIYFPNCTRFVTLRSYVPNEKKNHKYPMGDILLQLEQNCLVLFLSSKI